MRIAAILCLMALHGPLGPVLPTSVQAVEARHLSFTLPDCTLVDIAEFWTFLQLDPNLHEGLAERFHAISEETRSPSQDLLDKGPHSLNRALFWISAVPRGRELLSQVLPIWRLDRKKPGLHFDSANSKEGKRLNQNPESMAFFVGDTVYFNPKFSFIVLVASLFHELVHAQQILVEEGGKAKQQQIDRLNEADALYQHWAAMDVGVGAATGVVLSEEIKEMQTELRNKLEEAKEDSFPVLIAMEHQAYRAQDAFIGELFELGAEFRSALADRIQARQWLAYPVEETLFRRLMQYERGLNIPASMLDAYFKETHFSTFE
ncbi:MAG: hypothetical protein KDD51_11465 [Bdellovibrionales bacterium]|nr:hypothetical protein [Bdellovibrionales bacterium]